MTARRQHRVVRRQPVPPPRRTAPTSRRSRWSGLPTSRRCGSTRPALGRAIGADAFDGHELAGLAVLVHTGHDRHWRTDAYATDAPFLTLAAVERLVAEGAAIVGIDSINIDDLADKARPAHSLLLGCRDPDRRAPGQPRRRAGHRRVLHGAARRRSSRSRRSRCGRSSGCRPRPEPRRQGGGRRATLTTRKRHCTDGAAGPRCASLRRGAGPEWAVELESLPWPSL